MRHPTEGVLRRLLDEPAGVAETDRTHVAACPQCLDDLAAARDDAGLVGAALSASADVDLEAAWQRLASDPQPGPRSVAPPRTGRLRAVLRRPATAVLALTVVLGGAGTAAAGGWLPIFRTGELVPVSIGAEDLVALPDLSAYGSLTFTRQPDVREVPDAAAAERETGLDVPEVAELPQGVSGAPTYQVGGQATATFTFDAQRAARQAGQTLPPVPAGVDGSRVRLSAGPGVAQVWTSDAGAPALLVARAVAPTAESTGVPFETVRDYLLQLPGLDPDLAAELRAYTADGSTLPLPVPEDEVTTSPAQVRGLPATVLETRDRTLTAVVWVDAGAVTVVAGSLDADEVLAVAEELR